MFTCRDGKGGELSSQASKMLYKPPGAVYIASYKERLDQSDCWKLFVQLWNYTKYVYIFSMCLIIAYLPQIISVIQFICVDGFFLYAAFKDCLSRRKNNYKTLFTHNHFSLAYFRKTWTDLQKPSYLISRGRPISHRQCAHELDFSRKKVRY